jgi:uncharacterized membrane protein
MQPLPRYFPLERAVALSDGVFAIVITILILGIDVPSASPIDAAALASQRAVFGHQLLVYVVTFWLIGMYWAQHGVLFTGLRLVDRGLVVRNLAFLLPVTLLPFVTQFMGSRPDEWRVVPVFAATNLFAAFLLERMWKHVALRPEIHKDHETALLAGRIMRAVRFFGLVLVSAVLISLLNVQAGILVMLFVPLVFFYNYVRNPLQSPIDPPSADNAS